MLFMVLQAVLLNACGAMLVLVYEGGWPEKVLYSASSALSASLMLLGMLALKLQWPQRGERKWVFLAGTCWAASMISYIVALVVGTPIGDFFAMLSVNVVIAAFLGRIILGEPLRWIHMACTMFVVGGALLISKPSAMFGQSSSAVPVVGYLLPVVAGFFDAMILICSRKSANASPWFHSLSTQVQQAVIFLILTQAPFLERSNFRILQSRPAEALGWIMAILLIDSLNIILYCTAAQWCPAGLSATVNNTANMVVGYMVQVLFFAAPLEPLSMIGAVLMLLSVVGMGLAREAAPASPAMDVSADALPPQEAGGRPKAVAELAEEKSLEEQGTTAFAAAEFIDEAPSLRRRGFQSAQGTMAAPAASSGLVACNIGRSFSARWTMLASKCRP